MIAKKLASDTMMKQDAEIRGLKHSNMCHIEEIEELADQRDELKIKLDSALEQIKELEATIAIQQKAIQLATKDIKIPLEET